MVGGVVSTTRTVNEQALLLPLESVATHRTVVTPCGNVLPDSGEQTRVGFVSQRSEVEAT